MQLVRTIPAEQASKIPTHIVISTDIITPDMPPQQLRTVCRRFVDLMFHCLAVKAEFGIYVPKPDEEADDAKNKEDDDDETEDEREETKRSLEARASIVHDMVSGLEDEFLPFVMQAQEQAEVRKMPKSQLGAVFTKRGGLQSIGSLTGCGFGVHGVFIGGL